MIKFNHIALLTAFITLSVVNVLAQNISDAETFFKLADDFKNKSQPDSAIFYYEKSAMEFISVDNTEKYIDAYNQIGILLTRQNKYDKAHEYLGKALQAGLSTDSISLSTATTYISLGVLYGAEDQFDQSLIITTKRCQFEFPN